MLQSQCFSACGLDAPRCFPNKVVSLNTACVAGIFTLSVASLFSFTLLYSWRCARAPLCHLKNTNALSSPIHHRLEFPKELQNIVWKWSCWPILCREIEIAVKTHIYLDYSHNTALMLPDACVRKEKRMLAMAVTKWTVPRELFSITSPLKYCLASKAPH